MLVTALLHVYRLFLHICTDFICFLCLVDTFQMSENSCIIISGEGMADPPWTRNHREEEQGGGGVKGGPTAGVELPGCTRSQISFPLLALPLAP